MGCPVCERRISFKSLKVKGDIDHNGKPISTSSRVCFIIDDPDLAHYPRNANQQSKELQLDYKGVKHHMKSLEQNNLVEKIHAKYDSTCFISSLFEQNQAVFDEIVTKLKSTGE